MSSTPRGASSSDRRRRRRSALGVWLWIVGFGIAVLVATYMVFVEPPPPRSLVIAGGSKGGAYARFANEYAQQLRREGLTVDVRETKGSVENLRLLGEDDSGVSVAIVQGGVAGPGDVEQFQALGSLYREPFWVFCRADSRVERLQQLAGKRVGVGPEGSGTRAVALRMLAANDLVGADAPGATARLQLVSNDVASAAAALQKGDLDAACFVAALDADYVQRLLNDTNIRLLDFNQHEAYRRRFRFLAPVTLPAGIVDLGTNVPGRDLHLLAPTAMLVARKDFHPAFVPLLLAAASRVHQGGDLLSDPGEFPSESFCEFPLSADASRFFRSGQPVLQRLLPFWLASLADRAKVMLIPLVMLLMPLFRAAPPMMRWRTRRKIYRWYSDLRDVDRKLLTGVTGDEMARELARLKRLEQKLADLEVPLSYMEEFYHLRLHLALLQHLIQLRSQEPFAAPAEASPGAQIS